ncbi:low molecular weight protein arginine phosphatase [Irregularibacter muris]|uniref:Low molecular weight protein arginine phosphatase n=1 Tax=Irregularibacter muris TaxID=1796619 RepID=A0AAE3HK22_9FIRM|nr:low molecular weight protein arginine phosphatase [Irregularibacter muris]MCR1900214.1 low molecular weight protein arginine phosphatase [Irregularibacter muris]
MMKILFVCTGNTCRSSMAEGIFKKLTGNRGNDIEDMEIISAGTLVLQQEPANPKAIKVMEDMDIDITPHTSQALTFQLAQEADLILTMTQRHKDQILQMEPYLQGKVFTLLEYAQGEEKGDLALDIPDPFGLSIEEYRKTAEEIQGALEKILRKLLENRK